MVKTKPAHAWLHAAYFLTLCLRRPEARAQSAATKPEETNPVASADEPGATKKPEDIVMLEKFVAEDKSCDLNSVLPTKPVESVFGFAKPLVETPRAATLLSSELVDKVGLRNIEDIARVVPSSYSSFRWGVQGGVSLRGVSADNYFRGMRRIDPQGNIRTV